MIMGRGLWVLPLAIVFGVSPAWGQDKPNKADSKTEKGDKAEGEGEGEPSGGLMEDTAPDPSENETYEEGRFAPGHKEKEKKKKRKRDNWKDTRDEAHR